MDSLRCLFMPFNFLTSTFLSSGFTSTELSREFKLLQLLMLPVSICARLQHRQLFQSCLISRNPLLCVWIGTGSQLESDFVKKSFLWPEPEVRQTCSKIQKAFFEDQIKKVLFLDPRVLGQFIAFSYIQDIRTLCVKNYVYKYVMPSMWNKWQYFANRNLSEQEKNHFRDIKKLRHLCQVCWQFLSMTADGATKLRKGHHVKNVSFPHVSTEHWGALNTLPEQTLFGELRGGHISSNWQRTWVFKLDGIHGPSFFSHTPKKPPTFCFHCLFFYSCTRSPQWRPDLYSLAQLWVAHHKELQGVCEVFHHLNSVPFI